MGALGTRFRDETIGNRLTMMMMMVTIVSFSLDTDEADVTSCQNTIVSANQETPPPPATTIIEKGGITLR